MVDVCRGVNSGSVVKEEAIVERVADFLAPDYDGCVYETRSIGEVERLKQTGLQGSGVVSKL